MKSNELIIALQLAIGEYGASILNDSKLINILLDLGAFKKTPYAKSVIRELIAEGYMLKITQANNDINKINSLVSVIASQSAFAQRIVEYTVYSLSFALGYIKEMPSLNNQTTLSNTSSKSNTTRVNSVVLKGEYSEKLPMGGEIKVSADSWRITYYFSGPDARYNGTFKTIYGDEIDKYIRAWKNNFKKYQELKNVLPAGGNSDYPGEMGMSIRFGFSEGVCLTSYHMPINDKKKLDAVVLEYENAKLRAFQVQRILKGEC